MLFATANTSDQHHHTADIARQFDKAADEYGQCARLPKQNGGASDAAYEFSESAATRMTAAQEWDLIGDLPKSLKEHYVVLNQAREMYRSNPDHRQANDLISGAQDEIKDLQRRIKLSHADNPRLAKAIAYWTHASNALLGADLDAIKAGRLADAGDKAEASRILKESTLYVGDGLAQFPEDSGKSILGDNLPDGWEDVQGDLSDAFDQTTIALNKLREYLDTNYPSALADSKDAFLLRADYLKSATTQARKHVRDLGGNDKDIPSV
jgi:hypothetical protein